MSTLHLLKTTRDGDRYVLWTTPVGTYLDIGSREAIESFGRYFGEPITSATFDRADATGTSDPGGAYGFDDTDIYVGALRGMAPEHLPRLVRRSDLEAFVLAAEKGDRDEVLRLSRQLPEAGGDA